MTFYSLIKPHRQHIRLALLYILIANLLSLVLPWGIKIIIDTVLIRREIGWLNVIVLGLIGVLILQSVFNFLRKVTSNVIGEKIVCDVRERIFWHIQKISLQSIKRITPSQILTRIISDVESVRRFIFGDAIDFIYAVLSLGFILIILVWMNATLTGIALLTLPLFTLIYFRYLPRLKKGYRYLRDLHGKLVSRINEILHGMAIIRVFTAEEMEKNRFAAQQKEILKTSQMNHALNVGLWIAIDFFTALGIVGVLWVGGWNVIHQRMTLGELIAFYTYLGMLFTPLIRLVIINSSYQEASAALNRINDVMALGADVGENSSFVHLPTLQGTIEFKNVFFGYSPGEDTLKDINFSVKQGEVVAIVGSSGAGKTTLMNLLIRFFDPQGGAILVDGHDLKTLDLKFYRRHLAVVLQDDYLFSTTIQDNICYGKKDPSYDQMEKVARMAQAHAFIVSMKEGYLWSVGDRGMHLSSGQRQRIALARALMRDPSILILDEATSAVDAITENKIQQSIRKHMKDKTVFIVAHRFSTIMEADKIIVLDEGRIVEMGDHNYLLNKGGFYSNLYLEQFKENESSFSTNIQD